MSISLTQAKQFEKVIKDGGVAVFPSDTVYGLACGADDNAAFERLYGLKRRALDKPSAVMFFDLQAAIAALSGNISELCLTVLKQILPGSVTVLVPNPNQLFPLASGGQSVLGIRVPKLTEEIQALNIVKLPIIQSSANEAGQADAREVDEIPQSILDKVDLVLDAGILPGRPSTVLDLTRFETDGSWEIVREGAENSDHITSRINQITTV